MSNTKQGDHRMKTRYIFFALLTLTLGAHASFYNQTTQIEAGKLPKNISTDHGFIGNPTQAQLEEAGWVLKAVVPFSVPEGYQKIANTRRIVVDGTTASEVWDVETDAEAEARAAAKEAARIAGLAEIYGTQVGQFATLLSVFSLTMPITEAEAATAMYAAVKADVTKTADSQMAMLVYNTLRQNLSNDDIYSIAKAIGVSE